MWLTSDATSFRAPCDACRSALVLGHEAWSIGLRSTVVEGTLRAEADVGFMTCCRGHRIVVRRTARPLVAVN